MISLLVALLLIPKYCSNWANKVVEHPSQTDRLGLITRLRREMVESHGFQQQAPDRAIRVLHSADIAALDFMKFNTEQHHESERRLIGIVWASSGIANVPESLFGAIGEPTETRADWALIKLFSSNMGRPKNSFNTNILRPDQPPQRITGVRPWTDPVPRFRVFKRGRTTDYTVGETNGTHRPIPNHWPI